ncbi:MAG: hypothetical protein IPN71_13740 [Fibrobacteres bacterium]|nr:hypothetical protein [Fibrobacterota bacterium]
MPANPSAILANKTSFNYAISNLPFSNLVGTGKVEFGVNTRTGRPVQEISLGTISGTGGIKYPFSIGYSAPTPNLMNLDASRAPDGPVGVGWNFAIPSITSDHKGTSKYTDDHFYANFGPWGGGILVSADGETFHLNTNPYVVIRPTKNSTSSSLKGWVVTFPDGTVLVLGGRRNAVRRVFQRGDKIGVFEDLATPFEPGMGSPAVNGIEYAYQWDLTEVRAPLNRGILRVDWQQIFGWRWISGLNAGYTRESWPSAFWTAYPDFTVDESTDLAVFASEKVIEKAALTWGDKPKEEVLAPQTYAASNPVSDARWAIQSKFLKSISFYGESKLASVVNFQYKNAPSYVDGVTLSHRLLAAVQSSNDISAPPSDWRTWNMEYSGVNWLSTITSPDGISTQYVVGTVATGLGSEKDASKRNARARAIPEYGSANGISYMNALTENRSECRGEFCFSEVRTGIFFRASTANYGAGRAPNASEIRVLKKDGDGFKQIYFGTFIENAPSCWQGITPPKVWNNDKSYWYQPPTPGGCEENKRLGQFRIHFGRDYFILDRANNLPVVYQYDGNTFVEQKIIDPSRFPGGNLLTGRYAPAVEGVQTVYPTGGDYFLWKLPVSGGLNLGGGRAYGGYEVVPVVRQRDGVWRTLNQDFLNCEVSNKKSENQLIGSNSGQPFGADCMHFPKWIGSPYGETPEVRLGDPSIVGGEIVIGANAKYFGIAMIESGAFQIYEFLPDRKIVNVTARIDKNSSIGGGATYNIDWGAPRKIVFGDDFFAISMSKSVPETRDGFGQIITPATNPSMICVWRWNGSRWTVLETHGPMEQGAYTEVPAVFPTPDGYVFVSQDKGTREIKRRKLSPKLEPWVKLGTVSVDAPVLVKATENYTWVEFAYTGQGVGWKIPNQTRLFYFNGNGGVRDLSASLTDGTKAPSRLFNLEISPLEDWMVGWATNGWTVGNPVLGANDGSGLKVDLLYVPLKRNPRSSDAGAIPGSNEWAKILQSTGGLVASANYVSTGRVDMMYAPSFLIGSGFWMNSEISKNGINWNFHNLYPSGPIPRFGVQSNDGMVVTSVYTKSLYSSPKGLIGNSVAFSYDDFVDLPNQKFGLGFDGLAQTPISNRTVIKQYANPANTNLLKTTEQYYYTKINGGVAGQDFPGQPWKTVTTNLDGTAEKVETAYAQHTSASTWTSGWSKAVRQILPLWTSHTIYNRGSTKTSTQRFDRWDTKTGQPVATMTEIQPGVGDVNEYRHALTVNQYAPTGLTLKTRTALYNGANPWASIPGDPNLILAQVYKDVVPDASGNVKAALVSAGEVDLAPNKVDVQYAYGLGVKTRGVDPAKLTLGQSLLPTSNTMERVSTMSVDRSKAGAPRWVTDNTTGIATSYVYEGLRSLPTAVAVNADPSAFAAFTAEDGMAFLNDNHDGRV